MNHKQKIFCEYFVKDGNATEAAKKAGYSTQTAAAQASRLLTNVNVRKYIKELSERDTSKRIMQADEVKAYLSSVIQDAKTKTADKIKAGTVLLRTSGEMQKEKEEAKEEAKALKEGLPISDEETIVFLPKIDGDETELIQAAQTKDGTIHIFADADNSGVYIYQPYMNT